MKAPVPQHASKTESIYSLSHFSSAKSTINFTTLLGVKNCPSSFPLIVAVKNASNILPLRSSLTLDKSTCSRIFVVSLIVDGFKSNSSSLSKTLFFSRFFTFNSNSSLRFLNKMSATGLSVFFSSRFIQFTLNFTSSGVIVLVLDACCGTGGFLIDAMAGMWGKIDKNKSLSDREKANLKNKVVTEYLWGADADKDKRLPISKIARMNMVLHGDGSNRIYWVPDSLDKELEIEKGIKDTELKAEADEFREEIIEKHKKFDVVLTNPPFSMRYEIKQPDEKRILEQYIISRQTDTNKLKASTKSNVLFIERYHDLLNPGGKLLTVIDESVLNADSEKDYRDYIRSHFVIKAIISLPKNTFVNADTGVKTSILYLIKRDSENGGQPPIFMAISENVGHTDSGKPSPDKNDLNSILEKFKLFESGKL